VSASIFPGRSLVLRLVIGQRRPVVTTRCARSSASASYLPLPEPIVRALTVISILEGFGAIIRDVRVPALKELFVEPIDGTALAHLDRGLFEAHARDDLLHP